MHGMLALCSAQDNMNALQLVPQESIYDPSQNVHFVMTFRALLNTLSIGLTLQVAALPFTAVQSLAGAACFGSEGCYDYKLHASRALRQCPHSNDHAACTMQVEACDLCIGRKTSVSQQ